MKTIYYPGDIVPAGRYAATIGFFDGVHLGHQAVVGCLRKEAAVRGLQTMVITFAEHPRQVVQPEWQPQLITTLEQKKALLAQTGIDVLVVLRFDRAMASQTAHDFMRDVLAAELRVALLLTGYDNRFGHDRTETFADYQRYGAEMGIEVMAGEPCEKDGLRYSSSLVRQLIGQGDMAKAARCLGRNYQLSGRVVHGREVGRTLGFPTANIVPENPAQIVPLLGVYGVLIHTESEAHSYQSVMNIGTCPTFHGLEVSLEAHLMDFSGNLYDQRLTVEFVARLRPERPFNSPDELVAQMEKDAETARTILKDYEKSN